MQSLHLWEEFILKGGNSRSLEGKEQIRNVPGGREKGRCGTREGKTL